MAARQGAQPQGAEGVADAERRALLLLDGVQLHVGQPHVTAQCSHMCSDGHIHKRISG